MDEDPPRVTLTDEEKKTWFCKSALPDLLPQVMSASFPSFSLPEKDEGFDEIRHLWAKDAKAKDYLKQWVLKHKTTTRVEDIKPSSWFMQQRNKWDKELREWNNKTTAYKA